MEQTESKAEVLHNMTTERTPRNGCPACDNKKRHTDDDFRLYHPYAGTGRSREHGAKE